jgi:hypothetical protein
MKITMMENGRGWGKNDERQTDYSYSGERWGERSESKVFSNREHYKKNIQS